MSDYAPLCGANPTYMTKSRAVQKCSARLLYVGRIRPKAVIRHVSAYFFV